MSWVATGAAVVGAASSIYGSISGAKASQAAADKQAKLTHMQRMEEIRRRQLENARVEGTAVAAAYASNLVADQGSPAQYLNALRAENASQVSWAREQSRREKRLIEKGGQSPGMNASLLGQAASGISNAVGAYRAAS